MSLPDDRSDAVIMHSAARACALIPLRALANRGPRDHPGALVAGSTAGPVTIGPLGRRFYQSIPVVVVNRERFALPIGETRVGGSDDGASPFPELAPLGTVAVLSVMPDGTATLQRAGDVSYCHASIRPSVQGYVS
jgi:hypothetical protein